MTPTFQKGNMWDAFTPECDLFCITTNSFVRRDGALVMGRGIALEAVRQLPGLQQAAGQLLRDKGHSGGEYGVLTVPEFAPVTLFQVKYHFRDQADLGLISSSAKALSRIVSLFEHHHGRAPVVHLNFPGIGWGHRQRGDVLPLLDDLPPCVTVWESP